MTTPQENKALVKRFYEAIEQKNFDALHAMCHADFVFYNQLDTPHPGVDGLIAAEKKNFDAFESFRFPIETLIAEGDKVAAYMIFEGRNQIGPCVGASPTYSSKLKETTRAKSNPSCSCKRISSA